MSLPDPLTMNTIVYNRVNQDNFGSEYFYRTAIDERRLFITHTNEKKLVNGEVMERHAVKYTKLVFATETDEADYSEVSFSLRFQKSNWEEAGASSLHIIRLLTDEQTITSTDFVTALASWQS